MNAQATNKSIISQIICAIIVIFTGTLVIYATDALAGKGAGGAHSTSQREIEQFNARQEADSEASKSVEEHEAEKAAEPAEAPPVQTVPIPDVIEGEPAADGNPEEAPLETPANSH